MIMRVIQRVNELYGAYFEIVNDKNQVVGEINFSGGIGSMEGVFSIRYMNILIQMESMSSRAAADVCKRDGFPEYKHPHRPYSIKYMTPGMSNVPGIIFNYQKKNICYRFLNIKYSFADATWQDDVTQLYVLGFGEKGMCCPVYKDGQCISEIHKDTLVYNGLNEFILCFSDYKDVPRLLIYACHKFVMSYYKPGEKTKAGVKKNIYVTKDKEMLAKCTNPYYLN